MGIALGELLELVIIQPVSTGYVECPQEYSGDAPSLFLAGGITGCRDWQAEMRELLADSRYVLLNPRRARFDFSDPAESARQIAWEHKHLRKADAVLFWFAEEQIQPITLYELGAWSMTQKPLFVGAHPEYPRLRDVEMQTRLVRPDVGIVHDLRSLAAQVLSSR